MTTATTTPPRLAALSIRTIDSAKNKNRETDAVLMAAGILMFTYHLAVITRKPDEIDKTQHGRAHRIRRSVLSMLDEPSTPCELHSLRFDDQDPAAWIYSIDDRTDFVVDAQLIRTAEKYGARSWRISGDERLIGHDRTGKPMCLVALRIDD